MTIENTGLRLGTTLFSLTNEFLSRKFTLEQLVAEVARRGLGPGLEIVGFQSIRGFPHVSDEFADRFRQLLQRHGLEASCLGINADIALRRGTRMTTEESVAYHEAQITAAAKLGFPVARYQFAAGPEVVRRLVPLAERVGVKLGLEVHAPHRVDSEEVVAYREMYARENSPYLGFIPDFGASAARVPPQYLDTLRSEGIGDDLIEIATDIWASDGDAAARRSLFIEHAQATGADARAISALSVIFNILSPQRAEAWAEIMPQVIHIHGKFYDFDAAGDEVCIPYEKLLPVFLEGGFNGFMSSEWEGHMYSNASGFEALQHHHEMCRKIMSSPRN